MSIKDRVLVFLSGIGAVFSAIFYVLFKQKKEENQALKKEQEQLEAVNQSNQTITEALQQSHQEGINVQIQNEELVAAAHGPSNFTAFNACADLLSK